MPDFLFQVEIAFTDGTSRLCWFDTTTFATEGQARAHAIATITAANQTRGKYLSGRDMSEVRSVTPVRKPYGA